ncbi:hypothetical protein [Niallia taxi]|uniref:hypothetical protein n=1 Tax=Niallia taxi TaxID=2499688 RepID=UPI0015F756C7|nr:hypothetical protein [Niallia taxi]
MNAAQMQEKSRNNRHKIAVTVKDQFINGTNALIEATANAGHYRHVTPIPNEPLWNDFDLAESVAKYYREKGFKVKISSFLLSVSMHISWVDGSESDDES